MLSSLLIAALGWVRDLTWLLCGSWVVLSGWSDWLLCCQWNCHWSVSTGNEINGNNDFQVEPGRFRLDVRKTLLIGKKLESAYICCPRFYGIPIGANWTLKSSIGRTCDRVDPACNNSLLRHYVLLDKLAVT